MGVVKFADEPTLEFDLNQYNDRTSLKKAVLNILHLGGDTFIGKALSNMTQYFEEAEKTRGTKVRNILIVITVANSWDSVNDPAAQLRARGVSIYAIGLKEASKTQLQDIAGDSKRVYYDTNFDALKQMKDEIVTQICLEEGKHLKWGFFPDVFSTKILNRDYADSHLSFHFIACKNMRADVIFLVDGSGHTEHENFLKMKEFMKTAVSKFIIGKNSVQVGVVQFGSYSSKTEFALSKFSDKSQMQKAINDIQQKEQPITNMKDLGKGSQTGAALKYVSQYFDPPEGGRSNAPQFLIMITSGRSMDDVYQPAQALRNKSITIYSIGVAEYDSKQLMEISGTQDNVFLDRDNDMLKFLEKVFLLKICKSSDSKPY